MPQPVAHDRPPRDVLALPRPKKPTPAPPKPDEEMYDFNSPKKEDKKKKKEKKNRKGRGMLQVDRTFTPKEWQTIARSMNDRRRPYAAVPVRPRIRGPARRRYKSGYDHSWRSFRR